MYHCLSQARYNSDHTSRCAEFVTDVLRTSGASKYGILYEHFESKFGEYCMCSFSVLAFIRRKLDEKTVPSRNYF